MLYYRKVTFLVLYFLGSSSLFSQSPAVLYPEFHYTMGYPAADLSDRFGPHLGIGVGLNYQPKSSFGNLGIKYTLFFGSEVKEDVLAPFRTSFEGLLIGFDQLLSEMKLRERAYLIQLTGGGLIPVKENLNNRKSLKWQMGIGFYEHKIRFVDDARALPQFNAALQKGLDRLSNGWALIPSFGFESLSKRGKFSYYAGLETVLGFTQNQRSYHYDLGISELGTSRLDIMVQIKLALYLPFNLGSFAEQIEY